MKITTKTDQDDHGWELSFDNEFNLSSTKDVNKAVSFFPKKYLY